MLTVFEYGECYRYLECKAGIRVDDEEPCHDGANESAHEGEDCRYFLYFSWDEDGVGGFGDTEGDIASLVDGVDDVGMAGRLILCHEADLFIHAAKRPDRVIGLYIDVREVDIGFNAHLSSKDNISCVF